MRPWWISLALVLAGCGDGSPTGPSPTPTPPATFAGSVTDTVTGAPVSGFSALIAGGRLVISAPGYVTRDTRVGASTVDLIPEAGFDLEFYRQIARGTLHGEMHGLLTRARSPSIYIQTLGLSASNVAALEQAARDVVPAMTGGRLQVQALETGEVTRAPREDWIVVDIIDDAAAECGRAVIGSAAGHVWLNIAPGCRFRGIPAYPGVLAHEIGHSLGFRHVDRPGAMMRSGYESAQPTEIERHHAAIAYKRPAGNRDIDVDP